MNAGTNDRTRTTIDRRAVVAGGLGALAAPAVLRVIPANAQSRTIRIGHVSPKTGPLAGFGEADGFILDRVRDILAIRTVGRRQDLSGRDQQQG
jgi:branched-chain amino acid transport system substrate-binding protein